MMAQAQVDNGVAAAAAFTVAQDAFGQYRADSRGSIDPLPGIQNTGTYHWSELMKYLNRWYYKDVARPEKGKNVPIFPYRDCPGTCPMRIRWADPSKPMFAPFGAQAPLDPSKAEGSRMTLDVCVEDSELLAACHQFDERNLQMAYQNRAEWFDSDELGFETVKFGYKNRLAFLKKSKKNPEKSKLYKPLMRFKINTEPGDWQTKIYVQTGVDRNGGILMREGSVADLGKFCNVVPIADFKGNWIMGASFGPLQILHSVLVVPAVRRQDDIGSQFGVTASIGSGLPNNGGGYGYGVQQQQQAAPPAGHDAMQVDGDEEDLYDAAVPVNNQPL